MAHRTVHEWESRVWALARERHGVVTRGQLLELGMTRNAIEHRVGRGRLHAVHRGVYAIGRPQLGAYGRWMAAVLSCGPQAVLSHESAAALWRIRPETATETQVSVRAGKRCRSAGVAVHRRPALVDSEVTRHGRIPVTTPLRTLIDIAPRLERSALEAAINEADRRGLTGEQLRATLDRRQRTPGTRELRQILHRETFVLTDSELERRFLPLARAGGLPLPETDREIAGFKADFCWPKLGLVVETDGLRYHRTPAQQARDRLRDQAYAVAGFTTLRFTHSQVVFQPDYVRTTLAAVARRLRTAGARSPRRAE
jgi:hypothetical protein